MLYILIACVLLLVAAVFLMLRNGGAPPPKAADEVLYQGGSDVQRTDLVGFTAVPASGGIVVTLSFAGSNADGVLVPIYSIPTLRVLRIRNPERVAIEVTSLANRVNADLSQVQNSLISGTFILGDTIYLQMSAPVNVSLEGVGGKLVMRLSAAGREAGSSGYACLIDTVTSHAQTPLLASLLESGFRPALAQDGKTIFMLGERKRSRKEAETLASAAHEIARKHGSLASPSIIRLDANASFSAKAADSFGTEYEKLANEGRVSFELVLRDARPLAVSLNESALVQRSDGNLLLMNKEASRTPLSVPPRARTASVNESATCAAVLLEDGGLVCVNLLTNQTRDLGLPVTPNTTAFAWISDTILVAMTGDPIRLYSIDIKSDFWEKHEDAELDTIRLVDQYAGEQGELLSTAETLLFKTDGALLYWLNLEDRSRRLISAANKFAADAEGMRIVTQTGDASSSALVWHDLDKGERLIIGLNLDVSDFSVSADGRGACIILREQGKNKLYSYTPEGGLAYICALPNGELDSTPESGAYYFSVAERDGSWSLYKMRIARD